MVIPVTWKTHILIIAPHILNSHSDATNGSNGKPWRGEKTTDGGITPGNKFPIYVSPERAKDCLSFVPSALHLFVPNTNGDYHPRLCSCQPFRLMSSRTVFSGFAFFLPPKEDILSFEEDSPFSNGRYWKFHTDGKARFHECMVLANSSGDIVPVFIVSFFFLLFTIG